MSAPRFVFVKNANQYVNLNQITSIEKIPDKENPCLRLLVPSHGTFGATFKVCYKEEQISYIALSGIMAPNPRHHN
jgi:hypothetical protein